MMDAISKDLLNFLTEHNFTMIEQLHQWCAINSGTDNLSGLQKMVTVLQKAFQPLADSIECLTLPPLKTITMAGSDAMMTTGNALLIRKRPHLTRRILLSGHMDTVYSAEHPFQQLKTLNDNQINGPGVADMKGGLIVMLHALQAFEQTPESESLGWDVFINADEEIGSPASGPLLEEMAHRYQAALVYEPAMDSTGTLAKNRKGSGKITLVAHGKSAHAGRAFNEGRNAICYLAEVITRVNALNGQRDGVTINVGKIAGGHALNVVPDRAVAKLDVRLSLSEDEFWVRQELQTIQDQLKHPDYALVIDAQFGRPVKRVSEQTLKLFERISLVAKQMGLTIDWKDSGGCCDGNNLARHGLPVIDTLGVRGGAIHSSDEFIMLDSLVERSLLSALLLRDLAQGGLEELHQ